jgi:hypothetical protein
MDCFSSKQTDGRNRVGPKSNKDSRQSMQRKGKKQKRRDSPSMDERTDKTLSKAEATVCRGMKKDSVDKKEGANKVLPGNEYKIN